MKKLNYFVMLGLSATLILASCSQQRYANRARVSSKDLAKEQVKEEKKEVASVTPKPAEAVTPELKQPAEEAKAAQVEKATPKVKEVFKQLASKETVSFIKEAAKDPKKIKDLVVKQDNQTKRDFTSQTGMNTSKWLTLLIIGLVLLVIAWFLPFPLRGIFNLVGSVLVVVALIFLIIELLGGL